MADTNELRDASKAGALARLSSLIAAGADLRYRDADGYDAIIDAVHGPDETLLDVLRLLIAHGVELSGVTVYHESGLRVLSRLGRFDGVRLLLDAGADATQLGWTALHLAVVFGSLDDVRAKIGADLETRDWWDRTPFLLAVRVGDIPKAALLLEHGADKAAVGRCGRPPLFYAVEGNHAPMLRWLLERGADLRQADEFGQTPLAHAVSDDDFDCVEILLAAGAEIEGAGVGLSRRMILRMLDAGADPAKLECFGQRIVLGLPEPAREVPDDLAAEQFREGWSRTFGRSNPTHQRVPFWEAMIRAGCNAYAARRRFKAESFAECVGPVWCADRFGQSLTLLPDGGAVQIGGEHEDSYDPDFCIYNDVFVFAPDGAVTILGYPEDVFPPTDFHTATLVDGSIWIIGSLGYHGTRRFGETPIHRLDLATFRIERVQATGDAPGWIYKHRAAVVPDGIRVWGGTIAEAGKDREEHRENGAAFVLDLGRLEWRREQPMEETR